MNNLFTPATKAKLRLAIDGPAGSGKTYTALTAATAIADGGKIALIDSEAASASIYADKFSFDTAVLPDYHPNTYIQYLHAAEQAGYAVVVIDSISHEWDSCLELVDKFAARNKGNSFGGWGEVTPLHKAFVEAIQNSPIHVIVTMRSKMDHVQERDANGRTIIRKVGLQPIQRPGAEYEFTILCSMDVDHNLAVSKSRMDAIADAVIRKPGQDFFRKILAWLNDGADPAAMTVEEAGEFVTPRGLKYAALTQDQLRVVIERTTNPRERQAAELLLAQVVA
jgi:KaiC/GvpD/RAD55 family RecA-like ATPase